MAKLREKLAEIRKKAANANTLAQVLTDLVNGALKDNGWPQGELDGCVEQVKNELLHNYGFNIDGQEVTLQNLKTVIAAFEAWLQQTKQQGFFDE